MRLTKHAEGRLRQRGWSEQIVDIVMTYGRFERAPGGAVRVFIGNREAQTIDHEIKALWKLVSRARGGTILIKDDCILTVYKK